MFRSLLRMIAVPVVWFAALVSGSAATPLSGAATSLHNDAESVSPSSRSEMAPDQIAALHSLLGEELVPSDRAASQAVAPEPVRWRMAAETPPPPPP